MAEATSQLVAKSRELLSESRRLVQACQQERLANQILLQQIKSTFARLSQEISASDFLMRGVCVWLTPAPSDPDYHAGPLDVWIGARLAQRRRRLGLNRVDVAKGVAIDELTLAAYEAGRRRVPSQAIEDLNRFYGFPEESTRARLG